MMQLSQHTNTLLEEAPLKTAKASLGISAPRAPKEGALAAKEASKTVDVPAQEVHPQAPIRLVGGPSFQAVEHSWHLSPEERELVSASISQTWTDQAMKCYMSGADCANCDIPQGQYSFVCQMEKVVPVLLESLGQPDAHRLKRIYPQGYPHTAY